MALPLSPAARSASGAEASVSRSTLSNGALGCHDGAADRGATAVHGHTSWQMSHPYTCEPIAACSDSESAPFNSIVMYEMHRFESRMPGPTSAWVGQASIQSVHVPHWSYDGESSSSGR